MNPETKEQLWSTAIAEAHDYCSGRVAVMDEHNEVSVTAMAGAMADQLVDQLQHLAQPVLTNQGFIAGFISGVFTAMRLAQDEDLSIGYIECEEDSGHDHLVHDAEVLNAYLVVALRGVTDAYYMYMSIGDLSAELEG